VIEYKKDKKWAKKCPLIKAGLNPYLGGDIEETEPLCCTAIFDANF